MSDLPPGDQPTGIRLVHPDSGGVYYAVTEDQADGLAQSGWERAESGPAPDSADGSIGKVLARVGDNATLAASVLDKERAKGGKARSSLIDQLEAIVNTPTTEA